MILTLLWIAAAGYLAWDVLRTVQRRRLRTARRAASAAPENAPSPRTALAVSRIYMGDMLAYQTTSHDSGARVRVRKGTEASIVQVLS